MVSNSQWQKESLITKLEIPASELEHKIRLLTLASLAFQYVGQCLPYAKIAEALQVDVNEVEKWAIDGTFLVGNRSFINSFVVIRAGLVSGKLSQTTQSLYIIRATSQNFEQEQWRALEQRLVAWKTGLSSILDVVTTAKKTGIQVTAQAWYTPYVRHVTLSSWIILHRNSVEPVSEEN